ILMRAWRRPGRQVIAAGRVLARLLWQEGRIDEMRGVIETCWRHASQPDWPRAEDAIELIREHIVLDFESLAGETLTTTLDSAGGQAPEDDRVGLGRANLAIRTGRFVEARRLLDACLGRRPEDPAVWQAVLDRGLAAERSDEVRRALVHLPAERF